MVKHGASWDYHQQQETGENNKEVLAQTASPWGIQVVFLTGQDV